MKASFDRQTGPETVCRETEDGQTEDEKSACDSQRGVKRKRKNDDGLRMMIKRKMALEEALTDNESAGKGEFERLKLEILCEVTLL